MNLPFSRIITSSGLAVLLVFNSWPVMAAAAVHASLPDPAARAHLLERFDRLAATLERLRTLIDRRQFDLEALLASLDYDPASIAAFVKADIGLELYPGTLRGSQGTLMSRAGNALDQSILLAKLLKDAGVDARIARATLSEAEARLVVAELRRPRSPAPAVIPPDRMQEAAPILQELQGLGVQFGLELGQLTVAEPTAESSPVHADVMRTAAVLEEQLRAADIALGAPGEAALAEEAADYFWVQYREGPGAWENVHPVFPGDAPFDPEFNTVYSDTIPAGLQHRFAVQVFIERIAGGKREVKAVSVLWERPTANLTAVPLVFANLPNTLMNSAQLVPNLHAAVEQASWFVPLFEGGLAPESEFFDKNGTLIDPMAAGDPAAGVFQKIGDLFGKASGGIGGEGAPVLTAQWIEFTFTAPDGSTRKHVRTTFDRLGAARRQSGEATGTPEPATSAELAALLQRHTFMLTTGDTPRAMAVDSAIQSLLDSRPVVQELLSATADGAQPPQGLSARLAGVPQYWTGHLGLFTLLDKGRELGGQHLIYRSGPSLVVHTEGLSGMNSYVRAIDIVQNPRRAVDLQGEWPALDPGALIAPGVWESTHEGMMLGPSNHLLNASIAFKAATAAGSGLRALAPGAATVPLGINDDSKAAMAMDLGKGFAVVAPAQEPPDGYGWWRIDPRTGETLGQIADGRGGAVATEYLEGLALGISISLLAVAFIGCTQSYDPATLADVDTARADLACCLLANLILFALGFLIKVLSYAMLWDAYWSQQSICQG